MSERWISVSGWEGFYEVSSQGRVRSVDRVHPVVNRFGNTEHRKQRGQLLATPAGKNGYQTVSFTRPGGVREYRYVHELVTTMFHGPRPPGLEACHRNGVKADCREDNLRWGTRSSNALDRHEHETMNQARGEAHYFAKLTADDVRYIRSNRRTHRRNLAAKFGVHPTTIDNVLSGKQWKHVG